MTTAVLEGTGRGFVRPLLVAVVGLAMGTGWLTRLAGAVAVIGLVLFAIEVYRSSAIT
jgi:hypothetical protein